MDAAEVLAHICDDLEGMRRLAERRDAVALFGVVINAVRLGQPPEQDQLEELVDRLGLGRYLDQDAEHDQIPTAGEHRSGGGVPTVTTGSGHVSDRPYACPAGMCQRHVLRRAGTSAPMCDITNQPLTVG
jgi:hypothetical protein